MYCVFLFFQAEDGIRDAQESRGLGDVYKRQPLPRYSIIDRYVQLGGRRVVLGSDAHISVKLGNAFSSVVRKLPNTCVIGYFKNRVFYEL